MKPWEYDFSYSVLRVLEILGIARNIRLPKIALGTSSLHPLNQNIPDPTKQLVADEPTLDGSPKPVLEAVGAYSRPESTKSI
jgi:hypothetical protein